MTEDKWQQLVEMAQKHFQSVKLTTEDLFMETHDGPKKHGTQDVLVFDKGDERYKLVRENKPVVLEKKEHYSTRAGDTARTEYKFSETEFFYKLRVYKEEEFDEWEEITLENLGL